MRPTARQIGGIRLGEVTHLQMTVRPTGDYYSAVANARQTWQTPMLAVEAPITAERAAVLSVTRWDRDRATGAVHYEMTASGPVGLDGAPCYGGFDCALEIEMFKTGSAGEMLSKGKLVTQGWTNYGGQNNVPYVLNQTYTSPSAGTALSEVTHLRLTVSPTGDYYNAEANARTAWQTAYVEVEQPAVGRSLVLMPERWLRGEDGTTRYTLRATGTVALDTGPCDGGFNCRLEIRAFGRDAAGALVDRGQVVEEYYTSWAGVSNVPYRLDRQYISEGVNLGAAPITLLKLSVYPAGDYYNYVANSRQAWHTELLPVGSRVEDGHDLDQAEAAFVAAAAAAMDPCLELFPVGPRTQPSSLNDYQVQCYSARARGMTWQQIFATVAVAGGAVLITEAATEDPDAPVLDPRPQDPLKPPASAPRPPKLDDTIVEVLVAQRLQRGRVTSYSHEELVDERAATRQVVLTCVRLAVLNPTAGVRPDECGRTPIFAPGDDVREAAEHDWDAISSHEPWLKLTHASREEKAADGYTNRKWYDKYMVECPSPRPVRADGSLTACDEYPFFTTDEGGEKLGDTKQRPSLKIINRTHNSMEGTRLQGFQNVCRLGEAPPKSEGRKYLVVPILVGQIPTTSWC